MAMDIMMNGKLKEFNLQNIKKVKYLFLIAMESC